MPLSKPIAVALVALTTLIATAPAQAHSSGGSKTGLTIQFGISAAPAHYRGVPGRWGRLSPDQVVVSLRRQGFDRVRITGADARFYRAVAVSPRSGRVALTVSARSGRIIDIDRIGPRRHHYRSRGQHRWSAYGYF